MRLDLLPPDLAGQVQALQEQEWTSPAAQKAFEELMDELAAVPEVLGRPFVAPVIAA